MISRKVKLAFVSGLDLIYIPKHYPLSHTGLHSHSPQITQPHTPTLGQNIFSSPEPSGSQGELIIYPGSGVRCRCRRQQCLYIFSSETAWPIKAKLYVEPPWEGGTKVYINGPGHLTKMAPCPYMVKTFKNLLLQNQKSYDLETWHVALGTQVLQSLYKWWPWVDLILWQGQIWYLMLLYWKKV